MKANHKNYNYKVYTKAGIWASMAETKNKPKRQYINTEILVNKLLQIIESK